MDAKHDTTTKLTAEQALRAGSPKPVVRRLNRKAVALLVLIVGLLFAGHLISGMFRGPDRKNGEHDSSRLRPSADIVGRGLLDKLPADYLFTVPRSAPPEPKFEPQVEPPNEPAPDVDPEELKRREKLRKENELAMDSPVLFSVALTTRSGPSPSETAYSGYSPDLPSQGSGPIDSRDPRSDAYQRRFFTDASRTPAYVGAPLQPPRSPYEVKAGSIIPAALLTAINSDLPGDVIGQVTTDVLDTVSGRFLLIPQGARLIGRYNSEVHQGQNRVLIAWQRLVLPNGYSIALEAMPGTDAIGVAGMTGEVDWHATRLAGATALSTVIALGGNLAGHINPKKEQLAIAGETVAQQGARIGQRVIDRELDLEPTIKIAKGTSFNVLVNKDLILAPYFSVIGPR